MEFIETMLCKNGQIELLEFHLDRLKWGLYQNEILSANEIISQATHTILSNSPKDSKKYKIRYRIHFDKNGKYSEKIEVTPLVFSSNSFCKIGFYTNQVKKVSTPWNAKTTDRAIYQSAINWAHANHLEDAFILNNNGHIIESCICNVFILKDNILKTPPLSDMPVKGVFRTWMMHHSVFPIIEQSLSENDIITADLILLTNGVQGIRVGMITPI